MRKFPFLLAAISFISCFLISPVLSQPSGGPYGPVRQKYDLPGVTGKIYYAAPDGKAADPGI